MKYALKSLFAAALASAAVASQAAVVSIDAASFVANAGQITFSEYAVGTTNPTYTAAQYGGSGTAPDVSFGSFFAGQSTGTGTACGGAGATQPFACIVGSPTGPLSLDPGGTGTVIQGDTSHTGSPVLSGVPLFNGAIAMLFSTGQAAVSLDGGFFNAIGTTSITAYGFDGALLGQILNTATGVQTLFLGTDDGLASIAGLLISLVAPDDAGFTIDNVRFGTVATATTSSGTPSTGTPSTGTPSTGTPSTGTPSTGSAGGQVPEPTSLALVGLALLGLGIARRRRA